MSLRIEKYNAARLEEFIVSPEFRDMPAIPVSKQRAHSWLNNPRMEPDDILMYLSYEGDEMLGYRCILPDRHGDTRFGWLSGIWVMPSRRREGIASLMLHEAIRDWKGKLMYTNYAPESKAVYDKSGYFNRYAEKEGMRYYLRSAAASLLKNRSGFFSTMEPVIGLADRFVNLWQDARITTSLRKNKADLLMTEPLRAIDTESFAFLASHDRLGFGLRDQKIFDWINTFPWVLESGSGDHRYFFSSTAAVFGNHYLKILDAKGKMTAFLMLVQINDRMTLPYACIADGGTDLGIKILDHYLASKGIACFTTWNPEIISLMKHSRLPVLGKRKMMQKYFAAKELLKVLPASSSVFFQDGDGDCVFT